jgi:TonB-linked SusC/RagA family outer membrane protein
MPKLVSEAEEAKIVNEVFSPSHWAYYQPEEYAYWTSGEHKRIDWLGMIYQTPTVQKHALNVTGGNEAVKYFISGTYFDQNGFLPNLSYNKLNLRASVEAKITNNLTATLMIDANTSKQGKISTAEDGAETLNYTWGYLINGYTYVAAYLPDGRPINTGWTHPIEALKSGYIRDKGMAYNAIASLEYKIPQVPGLSIKGTYNRNQGSTVTKNFQKKYKMWSVVPKGGSYKIPSYEETGDWVWSFGPAREFLQESAGWYDSYQANGQIAYTRDFGKHHVDAVGVYEQFESIWAPFSATRSDFPLAAIDQFAFTSSDRTGYDVTGSETPDARESYVARLNYAYADKYLVSASVRRDGSYRFAPDQRWGTFPAISLGWRISEESFFKENVSFMDLLKLRATYGKTGNDAVGGWQWYDRVVNNGTYVMGDKQNSLPVIKYSTDFSNANLTWEKANSYNLGVDTRFFKSFGFNAEYWFKHSYDILGSRIMSLPGTFGASLPDENYGQVDSHGFELELSYEGKAGKDFTYFARANFAYATNKVVKMDVPENVREVDNPIGKSLGYQTGYVATDIIRTQEELDKLPAGYTINGIIPFLGMLNYQDVSGPDSKPDGKIDDFDRQVVVKHGSAPYTYGLNLGGTWKGISLELFFQGRSGYQKYNWDGRMYWYLAVEKFGSDIYLPPSFGNDANVDGTFPYDPDGVGYNASNSTFWLYDAGYLRMKNATLGYVIPVSLTKKAGIEKLQVFVSGTNLFVIHNNQFDYDPEQNNSTYWEYPIQRTITFGVNVTL